MDSDLPPHARQAGGDPGYEHPAGSVGSSRAANGAVAPGTGANRELSRQQLSQSREEHSTSGMAPADSIDSASNLQRTPSSAKGRAQDDSLLGRHSQGSAPIKAIQLPGGAHSEPPSVVPSLSTSPGLATEDWLDSKERFMAVMQNFLPKGSASASGSAAGALYSSADLMKGVQELSLAPPQDLRLPGMTMDPPASAGLHSWPLQQRPHPQAPVAPRTSSLNTIDAPRAPASWAPHRLPISAPAMDPSMMLLAGMHPPGMGATSVDPMDPNAQLRGLLLSQGSAQLSGRMPSAQGPGSIEPPGLAPSTSAQPLGSAEGGSGDAALMYKPPVGAEDELQSLLQEQKEPSGPSRFLWVGNLLTRVNRAILKVVFEPYGPLDDVITFMGRMYAFVSFHRTEDAINAVLALQNRPLPSLTGDKPLLVNFRSKRVDPRPGEASDEGPAAAATPASPLHRKSLDEGMDRPAQRSEALDNASTRIWCGNIASHVTSRTLKSVFASYGYLLTDVAVFPARIGPLGYAFINFATLEEAVRAYMQLQNLVISALTGNKQLKMRFKPIAGSGGFAHADSEVNAAPLPDVADAGSLPSANLSNRLNPNNVHFDRDMASHYKALSKSDKEVLWARDRLANVGSQPPQGFASQLGQQRLPFAGAVSYPGGRQYLPGTRFDPTQLAASRQYAAMQHAVRSAQSLPPPGSGLMPEDVHLMRALQESAIQGSLDPRFSPQMTGMEGQYMPGHNPALLAQLAQMGRLPPVSPLADPGGGPNQSWPPPQPGQGYNLSPYPSQLPSHGSGGLHGQGSGLHGQGSGLQGHPSGGLHQGLAAPALNDPALQGLLPPGAGQAPPPSSWLGVPRGYALGC